MNQDSREPTAVLACLVDFSKAFNRVDHNIIITKLFALGTPVWLLKMVISFLSNRKMYVRYKGETSTAKSLPGGTPQGTMLGLLLFLVLINDTGFHNQKNNVGELLANYRKLSDIKQIHLKYVDALTLAEAAPLKVLLKIPED